MSAICLYDCLCVYIRETLEFCGSTPSSSKYLLWVLPVSLSLLHAHNSWLLFTFLLPEFDSETTDKNRGERKETGCVYKAHVGQFWATFSPEHLVIWSQLEGFPPLNHRTHVRFEEFTCQGGCRFKKWNRTLIFQCQTLAESFFQLWH